MTTEKSAAVAYSGERQAFLFEHMLEGVAYSELIEDEEGRPDWVYLEVNPAFHRLTGVTAAVGKRATEALPGLRQSNPELFAIFSAVATTGEPASFDVFLEPLGVWLHVHASSPEPGHFLAVYEDISARKESEEALARTSRRLETINAKLDRTARALRLLSLSDKAMVRASDPDALLAEVCELIVATGGYELAWVGSASRDAEKAVTVAAQAGDDGYLAALGKLTWAAGPEGTAPMATCIREEHTVAVSNLKTWKTRAPWKRDALARGYRASLDLPIRVDGTVIGGLEIWAADINAFDEEERGLFEELAENIGYGLSSLQAHRTTETASASLGIASMRLEQMVMDVTEAIGRVVETRDPYTQGHQERVAGLAKMIASEMGLSGDEIVAIEVTGLVHDVGKMKVPVEILAKPGRLDEAQYAIVKQHSRAGYEILKGVSFPWPVADIVLQHHERMDGSGYPNGLVGDEISVPARILALADVVEALSSHRPHRPAIGLAAAIAEISSSSGKFDPAVVDACVRLYEQGRIEL